MAEDDASTQRSGSVSRSYHERTVRAIRRIIRAVDIFSHKLQGVRGVTVPQLSCLLHVVRAGQLTLSSLAKEAELSASTAVGIIDRLERKGLVVRNRSEVDRRQVLISATPAGVALIENAPSPLQDRLAAELDALPELEQAAIALSLERIVDLMGITEVEASPILDTGVSLTEDPRDDQLAREPSPFLGDDRPAMPDAPDSASSDGPVRRNRAKAKPRYR